MKCTWLLKPYRRSSAMASAMRADVMARPLAARRSSERLWMADLHLGAAECAQAAAGIGGDEVGARFHHQPDDALRCRFVGAMQGEKIVPGKFLRRCVFSVFPQGQTLVCPLGRRRNAGCGNASASCPRGPSAA